MIINKKIVEHLMSAAFAEGVAYAIFRAELHLKVSLEEAFQTGSAKLMLETLEDPHTTTQKEEEVK